MIFDALLLSRLAVALSATMMLADAAPATAQRAPTSQKAPPTAPQQVPEPAAPTPEPAPDKPDNPGLLNELGKLFIKPADLFPGLKLSPDAAAPVVSPAQPGDIPVVEPPPAPTLAAPGPAATGPAAPSIAAPAPPAAPVTPTTATAPAKLPATGLLPQMMRGRASCPVSTNGAPNCKAGADKLCQDKGFAGGNSLDTDSARTCSAKALLAGARTIKDICKTETFVTRAMCQ